MIKRRDLILGGAGLATAGLAYALKPHNKLNLLAGRKMADIVPAAFGGWTSQGDNGEVTPETAGKLAARLYNEIVSRTYTQAATGAQVIMLIAYGTTQSELLQLHRPEACYPAVGYRLVSNVAAPIPVGTLQVPGRRIVAEMSDHYERIVYWTRVGEFLPISGSGQRKAQLQSAFRGYVPDGALFRFSSLKPDATAFDLLDKFVSELVMTVAPANRAPLLGTALARRLAA